MPIEFYNNDDKNQLYYYEVENAKRSLFKDINNPIQIIYKIVSCQKTF